jgi:OmpA-OmpF porin, OOP family
MKKTLIALIVLNTCAVATASAAGDAGTWYGGAKFGWSHYADISGNKNFNQNLTSSNDFNSEHDNVGGGVFGGYQINNWLAVEGGYDYLGNMQFNGNNGVNGAKMKSQGLQLSVKTSYALNDAWDLYGRFGAMGYRAETGVAGNNNFDTGVRPLVAAGTEYAFNKNWAGRLEYQWVSNVGNANQIGLSSDIHSVTAGVVYRFGQHDDAAPAVVAAPVVAEEVKTFNLKSDVMFGYDSATLTEEGKAVINQLYHSPEMQSAKDNSTTVIGYSDRTGKAEYNQALSARRAQAVAEQLIVMGMPAAHIQTEGRGASESVTGNACDNQTGNALIGCLSPDRRVVVQISGQ